MLDRPGAAFIYLAAALVLIALGAWLSSAVRRFVLRRRLAKRWRHARHGEEKARAWLERRGFTILDEQVTQPSYLIVNGEESSFTVRADYLVERNGVRAVVEVKTGEVADPSSRGTRRQILEYAWVYGVAEVYLFNADTEELHRIQLPAMDHPEASAQHKWWLVAAALATGLFLGALTVWWFS